MLVDVLGSNWAVAESTGERSCLWVYSWDHGDKLASWMQASPFKMALLALGLHWSFTISSLDPEAPTKLFFFLDDFQIIVGGGADMSE